MSTTISLEQEQDVRIARETANELAQQIGFEPSVCAEITLAVSEICQNAIVHGGGGKLEIQLLNNQQGVNITVLDYGKGIADIDIALQKGYSTNDTLGVGLDVAQRVMDKFEILTVTNQGTKIIMEKYLPYREDKVEYGLVSLPDERYQYNGDTYIIKEFGGDQLLVGLIDGIGQGYEAYQMAEFVKRIVLKNHRLPLNEILTLCHHSLLESDFEGGCAMNLALFTPSTLRYLTLGDTHGYLLGNHFQALRVRDGRVGAYHIPSLKIQEISLAQDTTLVLCTDGIKSSVDDENINLQEHANNIAIRIFNEFHRPYGDASVLVIKWKY